MAALYSLPSRPGVAAAAGASRDCKQAIIPAFVFAAGARFLQRASINCLIPHLVRNGPLILKGHIDWFVFLPSACVCVCVCTLCSVCCQSLSHSLPAAADIRPLSVNRTIDPVPLSRMERQTGCCVEGSWSGTASIRRTTSSASRRRVAEVSSLPLATESELGSGSGSKRR